MIRYDHKSRKSLSWRIAVQIIVRSKFLDLEIWHPSSINASRKKLHDDMSTTDDYTREEIHHRQVEMKFYRRSDGLYEVEGHLVDKKAHPFVRQLAEQDLPAGSPVHDIIVRLVIDEDMLVHDARASMPATPFGVCKGAQQTLGPLIGLKIAHGWNKRVRELLGGAQSCTHIMELLGPLATTAYQGLAPQRIARTNSPGNEHLREAKVDSCYAYSAEREVVARLWPHLYRPRQNG